MNNVQVIAPTKVDSIFDRDLSEARVKRVAAYCRVSTDSEEQSSSCNNQIEEWTKRILENPALGNGADIETIGKQEYALQNNAFAFVLAVFLQ